jgi:hypothetical protein
VGLENAKHHRSNGEERMGSGAMDPKQKLMDVGCG